MKFFKWFYMGLGNSKEQRFKRLMIIIVTIGIFSVLIVNVGYDKSKGGVYWKPADISINSNIGGE